jgi:hypothetical protein
MAARKFSLTPAQLKFLQDFARNWDWGNPPTRGFRSICSRTPAYVNDKLGVVVKRPNCIIANDTPQEVRVPTIDLEDGWVVQPIVKRHNLVKAEAIISKKLDPYTSIVVDLHLGNIGWWRGKAVMFDW